MKGVYQGEGASLLVMAGSSYVTQHAAGSEVAAVEGYLFEIEGFFL